LSSVASAGDPWRQERHNPLASFGARGRAIRSRNMSKWLACSPVIIYLCPSHGGWHERGSLSVAPHQLKLRFEPVLQLTLVISTLPDLPFQHQPFFELRIANVHALQKMFGREIIVATRLGIGEDFFCIKVDKQILIDG
jgi:hypothetical protein